MSKKLDSSTRSNLPACSRFADTPECNALWEGGWNHTRLWELSQKLERERNELREAMREIVACGLNCKDSLDEAEQMERIAKEALSSENAIGEARADTAAPYPPTTL